MSETAPAATPEGKAPEFEGEFDAERAKTTITNLRAEVADLKGRLTSVTAERDEFRQAAEKTGTERDEALQAAVQRAESAERTLAIKESGLPDDVAEEFADYLTGTAEEVAAKAARLASRLTPKEGTAPEGDPAGEGDPADDPEPPLPSRPTPSLTPTPGQGGDPAPEPFDPTAVAKAARASY